MPKNSEETKETKEATEDSEDKEENNLDFEDFEEEEIKDEKINFDNLNFNNFVFQNILSGTESPVLERIAGGQERPIFVGTIPQGTSFQEGENRKETEGTRYLPAQTPDEGPKYLESDSRINVEPARTSVTRIGREDPLKQEPFLLNSRESFERFSEGRDFTPSSFEKTWQSERFDIAKAGREDPLKSEETKYEKYKPETPKS